MRFLIINTDYPEFLSSLYSHHVGLHKESFERQMVARNDSLFGVADFYSRNLRRIGHEAWDIHANNEVMQKTWAREHGLRVTADLDWQFRLRRGIVPWFFRIKNQRWFYEILSEQLKHYKPDVLLNQDMSGIAIDFLREIKPKLRLLVGQHAATRLPDGDYGCYDLVISSFPPTIDYFRKKGIVAELNRMAFEESMLPGLNARGDDLDVSFIGSLSAVHGSRAELLEALCERVEQLNIWGPSIDGVSADSPLRRRYMGQAWGRDMYTILRRSKITINHHGDIEPYANNCRMYEATGVGTLLVTDSKKNLTDMFEPGLEVVTYDSPEECAEVVDYYVDHESERDAIAASGQRRTAREHTYSDRMKELSTLVSKYI